MHSRAIALAVAALFLANYECVYSFSVGSTRFIKSDFLHSTKLNLVSRSAACKDAKRSKSNQVMCNVKGGGSKEKPKWELSRFVSTFTFFNGNPLARIFPFLSSKSSLPRPLPKNVNRNEIILWDFTSLSQVFLFPKIRAASLFCAPGRLNHHRNQDKFQELMAPLDDVVMGGVSQSYVTLSDNGAFMAGTTSSRNNGGFCSCRSPRRRPLPRSG